MHSETRFLRRLLPFLLVAILGSLACGRSGGDGNDNGGNNNAANNNGADNNGGNNNGGVGCDDGCPAGTYCDLNGDTCVPGCLADSACAASEYCDPGEKRCRPGCRSIADCPAGERCDDHQCLGLNDVPPPSHGILEGTFTTTLVEADEALDWGRATIGGALQSRVVAPREAVAFIDESQEPPDLVLVAVMARQGDRGPTQIRARVSFGIAFPDVPLQVFGGLDPAGHIRREVLVNVVESDDWIGGEGTLLARGISGTLRFDEVDVTPGSPVQGELTLEVTRIGYGPQCAGGCLSDASDACIDCHRGLQSCADEHDCEDSLCLYRFCRAGIEPCVEDECGPRFLNCREGC